MKDPATTPASSAQKGDGPAADAPARPAASSAAPPAGGKTAAPKAAAKAGAPDAGAARSDGAETAGASGGQAASPDLPAAVRAFERSGEEPAHPGVPLAPPGIVPESDVRVHSPGAAQPHHYESPWAENLGDLPWGYSDGRLVALLRDPHTVFVYWDFSQAQIEQAFHGLGAARAMLKLWTAQSGGEFLREVEVHLETRGWYIRELPSGIELRVELWAVGERGARLVRAARPVRLPPDVPSDVWDELYVTIPAEGKLEKHDPMHQPLKVRAGEPAPPPRPERPRSGGFLGSSEQWQQGDRGGSPQPGGGSLSGRPPRGSDQ